MLYCLRKDIFRKGIMIMKKILSLTLAVLMLASMTVCIMADAPLLPPKNLAPSSYGMTLGGLLNYWNAVNNSGMYGTGLYTTWATKCPDCGGSAVTYYADGKLCWQCLNSSCHHYGSKTIVTPGTSAGAEDIYAGKCPECGKSGVCIFAKTYYEDGKIYDQVYCTNCGKYQKVENTSFDLEKLPQSITCSHANCTKTAPMLGIFTEDGTIYASYVCENGHLTKKVLKPAAPVFDPTCAFVIAVNCPATGSYKMSGSQFVPYGTEKVIEFTAKDGYVLKDVLVNGVSVGAMAKIKILVKSNVIIVPVFERISNAKQYTIKLKQNGAGNIVVRKNGEVISPDDVKASYYDNVTYMFTPISANYELAGVVVDGKNAGKTSSYTFSGTTADREIEVTFRWKCPYTDVNDKYLKAVEYVTEAGILGAVKADDNKLYFGGAVAITKEAAAMALAEMADTSDVLKTDADRLAWAQKNGLVADGEDLKAICDVQTLCGMVKTFLLAVGKENNVTFKGVTTSDTLRQTSIGIGLVSGTTFDKNRQLNRYDLAAVCNLITNLTYEE